MFLKKMLLRIFDVNVFMGKPIKKSQNEKFLMKNGICDQRIRLIVFGKFLYVLSG